jgi:hypothetical protein
MTNTESPMASPEIAGWRPDRLIRLWYWVAIAGFAGALLALALSTTRAPIYEASAEMAVGVDYPRTAPLDLLAENRVLDRVAALVTSDATLALVADRLKSLHGPQAAWSSPPELRPHTRLDRKASAWNFVGIAESPEDSARIANAWMDVTRAELDEAMGHAWQSLQLQSSVIVLACSEISEGASSDFFWECLASGPVLDNSKVERLRREIELSRGVLPIVSYEPTRRAVPDPSPILWDRPPLIVGGALAGMIVGGLLVLGAASSRRASAHTRRPGDSGRARDP